MAVCAVLEQIVCLLMIDSCGHWRPWPLLTGVFHADPWLSLGGKKNRRSAGYMHICSEALHILRPPHTSSTATKTQHTTQV